MLRHRKARAVSGLRMQRVSRRRAWSRKAICLRSRLSQTIPARLPETSPRSGATVFGRGWGRCRWTVNTGYLEDHHQGKVQKRERLLARSRRAEAGRMAGREPERNRRGCSRRAKKEPRISSGATKDRSKSSLCGFLPAFDGRTRCGYWLDLLRRLSRDLLRFCIDRSERRLRLGEPVHLLTTRVGCVFGQYQPKHETR